MVTLVYRVITCICVTAYFKWFCLWDIGWIRVLMLLLHIYHYCFVEELKLAKMQILPSLSCVKWEFGLRRPSREVCNEGVWWFIKPLAVCTQGNNSCCYVQYIYSYWVKKDIDSDTKMSREWNCKAKVFQRVYISTEAWTLQRVAQAGRHTGTRLFPAVGWRGRFFCFSLQSKQHGVLQAPNQTACSRVNRIWGVVMGTWYYRCKTLDRHLSLKRCKSSHVYMDTDNSLSLFWTE